MHVQRLTASIMILALGFACRASAVVIHVPADYATIQEAIDAAVDGDEILIAPGTYIQANLSLDEKAITIGGTAGAESTILEFTAAGPVGFSVSAVDADTIIENLTIANSGVNFGVGVVYLIGTPTVRDCIFENNDGSYPFLINAPSDPGSGATILNCVFRNNTITVRVFGATIEGCTFIDNSGPRAALLADAGSVTNCHFQSNHSTTVGGGAMTVATSDDVVIDGCTFVSNSTDNAGGGAIFVGSPSEGDRAATIMNCAFDGNSAAAGQGGAIHADMSAGTGTATVMNCSFTGNVAPTGGAAWLGVGATMIDCQLTSNSATIGGGVVLDDGSSISLCTFGGNTADNGGAISVTGTTAMITDCVANGNMAVLSGGGLHIPVGMTATATNSTFCMNTPDQIDIGGLFNASNVLACDVPLDDLGACCLPSGDCVVTTESSCLAAGGSYFGDGTVCADVECGAPCVGDVNGDGVVNVNDLLIVLAAWGICL